MRGSALSPWICSQLQLRSVGFKHSSFVLLNIFFFLKCANPVWIRVIAATEINGNLVTDETHSDNVPILAPNDAGDACSGKEKASYSDQKVSRSSGKTESFGFFVLTSTDLRKHYF